MWSILSFVYLNSILSPDRVGENKDRPSACCPRLSTTQMMILRGSGAKTLPSLYLSNDSIALVTPMIVEKILSFP